MLYAVEPGVSVLLQVGCSLIIIKNFAKINPFYAQFAILLARLPLVDALTNQQNFAVTQWLEPKILLQAFQCVGLIKIFSEAVMKLGKQIQTTLSTRNFSFSLKKLKDCFSSGWCSINFFPEPSSRKVELPACDIKEFPVTVYSP